MDDFHYICDGAYQRREMILMEINVFKTIEFDLGIPLSYRFLRRYARVNRIDMPVLTLARYILEFSLMDYAIVQLRDSKLACAALFIAMRMNNMPGWNKTLEFYSGRIQTIIWYIPLSLFRSFPPCRLQDRGLCRNRHSA